MVSKDRSRVSFIITCSIVLDFTYRCFNQTLPCKVKHGDVGSNRNLKGESIGIDFSLTNVVEICR